MKIQFLLWFECIATFVVIPLLLWLRIVDTPLILIPVFIICIPASIWLIKKHGLSYATFWSGQRQAERRQMQRILRRAPIIIALLFAIVYFAYPQRLFDMPRDMTRYWLLLMLVYPLLSVYPQELLYRAFFMRRYQALFQNQGHLLLFNAVLFGWMHIVLHNLLAVILSFVAGLMFADTYRNSQSLRLTCLEHALYGMLIFTLGYGKAFLYRPWFEYFSG